MAASSSLAILLAFVLAASQWAPAEAAWQYADPERYPNVPEPQPGPAYMVDNRNNYYGVAPDKGTQRGPVWNYSGSLEKYMENLANGTVIRGGYGDSNITHVEKFDVNAAKQKRAGGFWLSELGKLGSQPLAGSGYQFFRNVVEDFKADNTGETDASEALNAAVSSWNDGNGSGENSRCGEDCGNTFTTGAIIYFPGGTYKLCTPVIQLYYTQFIGDPNDMPIIKGCDEFKGIALFDTDPYIPEGSGAQWYINQNQFFRQIRNFKFDLTEMPLSTEEHDQPLVPTGIHWQVAQATSLQNLEFKMPSGGTGDDAATHVGIFTENGSGGFVSDLTFEGGNIGWRVGSQQFTARNLKFSNCATAIQMIWDWGFNWQGIEIDGGSIGFNISGVGGDTGQGTASVSLIDCSVNNVPVGILTNKLENSPNIVLDNTKFNNVGRIIQVDGGDTLLSGNSDLWATGKRYNGSVGSVQTGDVTAPKKAQNLLGSDGKLFVRSRPQYESKSTGDFSVATTDGGCKNDGTGDQTSCINTFLQNAKGKIAFFPAGIYAVAGTVIIPTGSVVQGSSWSQIQGAGYYFGDMNNPKVMIQVGNKGDIGTMEITEMLFSVKGPTAGAILMEWNVHESSQGSAAMWDSHFRVGGAKGSDLDLEHCPKFSQNDNCIAASLLFRVTSQASGYFENVWVWVADHDNDASVFNQPDSSITQISLFAARGTLIESQGPSWFYGGGSEHAVLYNYLLSGAKSIYMGHLQTESPYFQPVPMAPAPFGDAAAKFPNDPDYSKCNLTGNTDLEQCKYAWGMRIINSKDVTIHGAGLYSFFNNYYQDCIDTNNCQERILEVKGSTGVVIYNLFTVATVIIANGIDGSKILQADSNQRGFTSEVSVWLPLPGGDTDNIIYVGPEVFSQPTVSYSGTSCVVVFPTSSLPQPTTIDPSDYVTSFEYGAPTTTTVNGVVQTVFVTSTTTVTIDIPAITVTGMPFSNYNITSSGATEVTMYPSVDIPAVTVSLPDGQGSTTTRVVTLPPWPQVNIGPSGTGTIFDPGTIGTDTTSGQPTSTLSSTTTYYTGIRSTLTIPSALVTTVTFPGNTAPMTISCPATTAVTFATPAVTVRTTCTNDGPVTFNFGCPTTKVFTFLDSTTAVVSVDCILLTAWSTGQQSTTEPLPVWTTWPAWASIIPVTTTPTDPKPTDNGVVVPCTAWFFFICISWDSIHLGGWDFVLPPGIYPPGPPPLWLIKPPPGITIPGPLPPWPRITIGTDGQITTEQKPECTTKTADACSTTTIFSVTSDPGGKPTTTKTEVSSRCEKIQGCDVTDSDFTTTSTDVVVGTQTAAPVGDWVDEDWNKSGGGDDYSRSVFAAMSADIKSDEISQGGTVVSLTPGPTPSPTCASGTGCGGHLCEGYYCQPTPTGPPPGFQDPKDPSSGGFQAPTTTVGQSTTDQPTDNPTPTSGWHATFFKETSGTAKAFPTDAAGKGKTPCFPVVNALRVLGAVEADDQNLILCVYDNDNCQAPTPYNATYLDYSPRSPNGGPSAETEVTLGRGQPGNPYRPFRSYRVQEPHQVTDEQICA